MPLVPMNDALAQIEQGFHIDSKGESLMAGELRKTILETDDIEREVIEVPEWNTEIEVRGMSSKERAKLLRASTRNGEVDMVRWFPDLIIATSYDPETGEKIFEPADRDAVNEKSGAAISAISEVAARLSGLGEADVEIAKEELSGEILNPDST